MTRLYRQSGERVNITKRYLVLFNVNFPQ